MLLADENFPIASVRRLRSVGIDVVAIVEETPGATDAQVLQRAEQEQRIILTFDRDYGELIFRHRLGRPVGVVYFRYVPQTPQEPGEHLLQLLATPGLALAGYFSVVDRERLRQRRL